MNRIYIGDRKLEPDEDPVCDECDGLRVIAVLDKEIDTWHDEPCPVCTKEPDGDELL